MQETERSVSYPRERKDDRGRSKNSAHRLPGPDRQGWAGTAHRQRQGQSEGHQDLEVQDGGGGQVPPRQLHPQPRALHRRRAAGPAWATTPRPIRRRPRSPRSAPALRSACTPTPFTAAGSSTSSNSNSRATSTSPRCGAPATSARSRSASPMCASRSTWNARAFRRARSMRW